MTFTFQPSRVYSSNDCSRRNAAISGVILTSICTASLPLKAIFPWNGSASFRLCTLIGCFAFTETNTRESGVRCRVSGDVKSRQRSFAVSDRSASGISHTKMSRPHVAQKVALSAERLMNSG